MRNTGLVVAAMLAMSGMAFADAPALRREEREPTPEEKEAHRIRLKAAAEKRARKAAKRLKNMPAGV